MSSSISNLAEAMTETRLIPITCTVDADVVEALDNLKDELKKTHPKSNRSKIINSILREKLTDLKML